MVTTMSVVEVVQQQQHGSVPERHLATTMATTTDQLTSSFHGQVTSPAQLRCHQLINDALDVIVSL